MAGGPSRFFSELAIEGGKMPAGTTAEHLLSADYAFKADGYSEMSFEMYDPGLAYLTSFPGARGPIGKGAMYDGIGYVIGGFSATGGPGGNGAVTYRMTPASVEKLRKITGPLNRQNISASQYVNDACVRQGIKIVAQSSSKKPSIERDTPEGLGSGDERSEWTTILGLAKEEGYIAYECLGTIYFASPKWLFENRQGVNVYWGGASGQVGPLRQYTMLNAPSVEFGNENTEDEISFDLPIDAAGTIWPGHSVTVFGVPKIAKKLLVTDVKYAVVDGDRVSITAKMPWTVEKSERNKPQPKIDIGTIGGGSGGGVGMGPGGKGKRFYASEICAAAKERNLGRDGARNGIATALVETNLTMYANRAVPASLNYPHDAVGSDHDSVGLFQQRQAGWGTLDQRMNPRASAGLFFNAMMKFNWRAMEPGAACQKVQVSAFPGKYAQRMDEAVQWVNQVY